MSLKKKVVAGIAVTLSVMMGLAGCGGGNSATPKDDDSLMKVDVYDDLANYQGVQKGWFAKLVKDKFNLKLNYISPNVSGGGSTTFDTRSAAGNLGDIIITGAGNGRLNKLIRSKLVDDMTPYLNGMDSIKKYKNATDNLNKVAGQSSGVWGVPMSVSTKAPDQPSEGNEPVFGPYIRWDLYKKLGYPEIKNMDDFLDVLKQEQDLARKETGDNSIYAISLFKDWDGNMMNNIKQPICYYGYDEMGFVLAAVDGHDYQSVTQKDGMYDKTLAWFNKANQEGLVDPESSTQNFDTLTTKYKNGKVLFSFWSYLGPAQYNTTDHKKQGVGFMVAPLQNMKIVSYGATPNGTGSFIGLGSKARNKQRLVKFINWLYSNEGAYAMAGNVKGMNYDIKDGKPVLTDFGKKLQNDQSATVPKEFGGGSWSDGQPQLNFKSVNATDIDPTTGEDYSSTDWKSVIEEFNNSPLEQDWSGHMGGAKTTMEYLEKNNMLAVAPGAGYIQPDEDSQISTLRGSIKTEIVNDSWKAVFAKSDDEFQKIVDGMRTQTDGLGMKQVLDFDMKNAKDQDKARKAILKEYANREKNEGSSK
ncbi:multiple sugar transport system substrate-binding protein [Bifidobacterium bohemicum]|uniref:Putative extracellular solute-binding protein n=1 Tax=Bifidobacterium bohemicum DSM 22767 TaxID=1437606 RepID=A0A086ZEM0_9BIFI|nr:ABC transporter substrate-binding protein [Bifidobacterium bohemicum]KFI44970.1 putative extracellular solute-binding protein [Bifidobacterium bohemicum DSM 22767]SCC12365.1 multiple sugar transport system substrate-binding protein [Bifidobacterium bohemicum]